MAMHVRTEGDKSVFPRLLLTLSESKPHIIIIFHLKTNRQKLEKHHVNGSQTRISNLFLIVLLYIVEAKKGCKKKSLNTLSLAADLLKPYTTH